MQRFLDFLRSYTNTIDNPTEQVPIDKVISASEDAPVALRIRLK